MEKGKKLRYKEKIELVIKRINEIESIFPKFEDNIFRLAIYKHFRK